MLLHVTYLSSKPTECYLPQLVKKSFGKGIDNHDL